MYVPKQISFTGETIKNNIWLQPKIKDVITKFKEVKLTIRKVITPWTGSKQIIAGDKIITTPYYAKIENNVYCTNENFLKLWIRHNVGGFYNYYKLAPNMDLDGFDTLVKGIASQHMQMKFYETSVWPSYSPDYSPDYMYIGPANTIYNARKKFIVYLDNGHSLSTAGKRSPVLSANNLLTINEQTYNSGVPLFEWKWTRLLTDFLQAVLTNLGFSAFKIITEDDRICQHAPSITKKETWVDKKDEMGKVIKDPETGKPIKVKQITEIKDYDAGDLNMRVERVGKLQNFLTGLATAFNNDAVFLSIHCNAGGNGNWVDAAGWHAITAKGIDKNDILARYLYDECKIHEIELDKNIKYNITKNQFGSQRDIKIPLGGSQYCATVLTENLYMDTRSDVTKLLSADTFKRIIKAHALAIFDYFSDKSVKNSDFTKLMPPAYSFINTKTDYTIGDRETFLKELDFVIENRVVGKLNASLENLIKTSGYNENEIIKAINAIKCNKITDLIIQNIVGEPNSKTGESGRLPYLGIVK